MKNITFIFMMSSILLFHTGIAQPKIAEKTSNETSGEMMTHFTDTQTNVWDVLFTYKLPDGSAPFGCFYWEGKIYVAGWFPYAPDNELGKIWRYNLVGNTLEPDGFVIVPDLWGDNFYGFTTDGTYIYAVNTSSNFFKIDPITWTMTVVQVSVGYPSGIAYDKSTGGFWLSTLGSDMATHVTASGEITKRLFYGSSMGIMGVTYDDITEGGPYLITANGAFSAFNAVTLGRWHIESETYEDNIFDLANLPEGVPDNNVMGNISAYAANGKLNVVGVLQTSELAFALEIATISNLDAPAAVSNLTITPHSAGNLSAVLHWINPTLTYSGTPLTELTAVNVYENNAQTPLYVNTNPVIGGNDSYTATVPAPGIYKFSVAAENSAGEGVKEEVSAWIGEDVPAAPFNIHLARNGMDASLSWNAPTTGAHAGYFSGTGVKYDVYRLPNELLVANNITEVTFTETLPQQGKYFYKVVAKNNSGTGNFGYSNPEFFCLSIEIFPFREDFENPSEELPDCWREEMRVGETEWEIVNNAFGSPILAYSGNYKIRFFTHEKENATKLITPPMNLTKLNNVMLKFAHSQEAWGPDQDRLKVYYKTSLFGEWILLKEFNDNIPYWAVENIPLPNLSEEYYVAFEGISGFGHGVQLDDVTISGEVGISETIPLHCKISPNPVFDLLTVALPANYEVQIEIFNAYGAKVLETVASERETAINVVSLSSGIYFLRIINTGKADPLFGFTTQRFVKK